MVVDGVHEMPGVECWTELGLFGSSPVGAGQTYAFASATAPAVRAAIEGSDLSQFVELWTTALPASRPIFSSLGSIDDLLLNDVARVRCRRFVDGRMVLLGDAAHAMAPNLGQGANSAFLDAAVLVQELASAPTQEQALDRYDRRRRRVAVVQRTAERLARASHLRHPVARRLRDLTLRVPNRPAIVERQVRAAQQVDPADLARDVRVLLHTRS